MGNQPDAISSLSTLGQAGRLEVGEHLAGLLFTALELLPGRQQLGQVGGRAIERDMAPAYAPATESVRHCPLLAFHHGLQTSEKFVMSGICRT